ncbi:MAG TPA: TIGR03067 domain-containing protein [Verrucomicrobiae bacterium]|nr:TIGR03067 domain-containing protein [Verrucomicrobiae bacterium]
MNLTSKSFVRDPARILSIFLGFACAAALSNASVAAQNADLKAIAGVWVPIKAELGGQPMPPAVLKTITLKCGEGTYEVTIEGAPQPDIGTFSIEPDAKPKGMKVLGVKGPNAGKTFPAIYEFDGDSLRICYDLSGAKRPAEFKTTIGTQLYLVTYQRRPASVAPGRPLPSRPAPQKNATWLVPDFPVKPA